MVFAKLHLIKMKKGSSVEDYLNMAEDLCDHMAKIGKDIPNLKLVQIIFNALSRSFKGTISSISNMDELPLYDAVSAKLVSTSYQMKARVLYLGNEDQEALVTISQYGKGGRTNNNSYRIKKDSGQSNEDHKTRPIYYCCGKLRYIVWNYSENKYKPPKRKNKKVNAIEKSAIAK